MSNFNITGGSLSPRNILGSKKQFEAKLPTTNSATPDQGVFNERCIDIRTERTIGDYFREIYYLYQNDEASTKELGKKYLLKKLVKLFASDNISEKDKQDLEKLIKESETFKKKAMHIKDITKDDLMQIRSQVKDVLTETFTTKHYNAELQKALSAQDSDKEMSIYISLHNFYKDRGRVVEASKNMQKAVDIFHKMVTMYIVKQDQEKLFECFERFLAFEGIDDNQRAPILINLAKLYTETENIQKAFECYEQILKLQDIDNYQRKNTLDKMAQLYKKVNNIKRSIECHKQILSLQGISSYEKLPPLYSLADLYKNKEGNIEKAIEYYEQIISLQGIMDVQRGNALTRLAQLYENEGNIEKAIESYERILKLPEIGNNDRANALLSMASLYKNEGNIDKAIESYERILKLPEIGNNDRANALLSMASLYKNEGNRDQAIECYEQILSLQELRSNKQEMTLQLIIDIYEQEGNTAKLVSLYMKYHLTPAIQKDHPDDINFSQKVLSLFDSKSEVEALNTLKILIKNPKLWQGKNKLSLDKWTVVINDEDPLNQLKRWAKYEKYQQYITVSEGMNKDLLLNDPTMAEWNILIQPEGDIDDDNWEIWKTIAHDIFDKVEAGDENKKGYLAKFFDQCMTAADANTETGKQTIRKRVVACINYLNELKKELETSNDEAEKESLAKKIKGGLDIIAVGGAACADRAIVFLTRLETYIKLLENPKYLPNIMVLMYKFEVIKDYLTDPNHVENIETYLYYCLLLNLILGLGLPEESEMLYQGHAAKMPIEEALQKLSPGFNLEGLLEFTAIDETFQSLYEKQMTVDPAVMESGYAFLEADDNFEDAKRTQKSQEEINQLHRIAEDAKSAWDNAKHNFYKETARALFQEAGFINSSIE